MNQTLGTEKRKFLFLCKGVVSIDNIVSRINAFIFHIGMTPAREPRIDEYPYKNMGGIGYTGFFPLTESYVMVDVYIELDQTEILLSTCKPDRLDVSSVLDFLTKQIGVTTFVGTI